MMKVLAIIAAYQSKENPYLLTQLQNYLEVSQQNFQVHVIIQTVDIYNPDDIINLNNQILKLNSTSNSQYSTNLPFTVELEIFEPSVKLRLTRKHRKTFKELINNYDLFIYQEDDMGINADHIKLYLESTNYISSSNVQSSILPIAGFLRYEILTEHNFPEYYLNSLKKYSLEYETHLYPPEMFQALIDMPGQQFDLICIDTPSQSTTTSKMPSSFFSNSISSRLQAFTSSSSSSSSYSTSRPFLFDRYNPHQAFSMLTREQILSLHSHCGYLDQGEMIELPEERSTRVYMSSFSIFKADPEVLSLCGLQKKEQSYPINEIIFSSHPRTKFLCEVPKVIPWGVEVKNRRPKKTDHTFFNLVGRGSRESETQERRGEEGRERDVEGHRWGLQGVGIHHTREKYLTFFATYNEIDNHKKGISNKYKEEGKGEGVEIDAIKGNGGAPFPPDELTILGIQDIIEDTVVRMRQDELSNGLLNEHFQECWRRVADELIQEVEDNMPTR